jgi:hypothetical protein
MKGTIHRVSDRASKPEKDISDRHQAGFVARGSRGERFIKAMIPQGNVTCHSLAILAKIFSAISGIPFHRDYTRRRALVIKWFDDHIETLRPLQTIVKVNIARSPGISTNIPP